MKVFKNNYSRLGNMTSSERHQENIKKRLFIQKYLEKNFGEGKFFSKLNTYGCSALGVGSDY